MIVCAFVEVEAEIRQPMMQMKEMTVPLRTSESMFTIREAADATYARIRLRIQTNH